MSSWRKKSILFAIVALACAGGHDGRAAENELKFFRSDHGLADAACGTLPAILDAPGALRWRVPLEPGHATPILSGDRIFLTGYEEQAHGLRVLALDAKTGRVLWRKGVAVSQVERTH